MALITATAVSRAGTLITLATPAASDTIVADDETWYHVKNASAGSITVTISDGGTTPIGNAATLVANSVAAGTERLFALFTRNNDPITGVTTLTCSSTVTVTAAAFRA